MLTQKIEFPNFTWINYENPAESEIKSLARKYKFHPLNVADCISTNQRTKVESYPGYLFFVLLFPYYVSDTREIKSAEINAFIGKGFLITINHGELKIFNDFFTTLKNADNLPQLYPDKSPERLFYEICNKLFMYCFPMIDHLIVDCNNIEKAIFAGQERKMVSEILIIRRNITDFRKIMQVHKNVLKKAVNAFKNNPNFVIKKTDDYFESLIDFAKEIWDAMDNLKERIEAIQQTNESQISFQLSDIMRILTIISVLIFPITLISSIFGMNMVHSMPFINSIYGFWYVLGIMLVVVFIMLGIFKKKNWL
ncbi:MAG: magnesium transporter CorA family protein [Candidatus Buchananbacteria bacterium]